MLKDITGGYEKRDVFNMNNTAFFFSAAPSKTISTERIAGRNQIKKRLTVAVCCNTDEWTKLPLLFVGADQRFRCFSCTHPAELGVHYESTVKGRTTSQLFQHWLLNLNEQTKAESRRVLLLVGNVSLVKPVVELPMSTRASPQHDGIPAASRYN